MGANVARQLWHQILFAIDQTPVPMHCCRVEILHWDIVFRILRERNAFFVAGEWQEWQRGAHSLAEESLVARQLLCECNLFAPFLQCFVHCQILQSHRVKALIRCCILARIGPVGIEERAVVSVDEDLQLINEPGIAMAEFWEPCPA